MRDQELRDQIAALFRCAPGERRLGDEPPGPIADAVFEVVAPLLAEAEVGRKRAQKFDEDLDDAADDTALMLWLHAEAAWQLSELEARFTDSLEINRLSLQQVLTERDDAEASRRDWATEAEAAERRYQDLLGSIWLYVNWRYVTKQLTTEQKNLWADAVDARGAEEDHGSTADRWWADAVSRPVCAVHPDGQGGES